jgi:hypothetical protein
MCVGGVGPNGRCLGAKLVGVPRESSDVDRVIILASDETQPIEAQWFLHDGWTIRSTIELQSVGSHLVPRSEIANITGHRFKIHCEMLYGDYTMNGGSMGDQRGLRFDKVALRFVAGLQGALRNEVPDGKTILLTVSAPIRVPAQTAAALEERIRLWLARRAALAESRYAINGNAIRVRLVNGRSTRLPNVLGFVHNPELDAKTLLDAAQADLST